MVENWRLKNLEPIEFIKVVLVVNFLKKNIVQLVVVAIYQVKVFWYSLYNWDS